MAQDPTTKQTAFVNRYAAAVNVLFDTMSLLENLKEEWDANGYATGSPPVSGTNFVIGDLTVQMALPACTAAMLNSAVGAVESIRTTFNQNVGYLVVMKP